ncbi:hypothetical protein CUM63_10215 [Enterococcus faecium]|uniref:hypothetical protein n=1 Tax=Enterococcus faecium TaxID=1352 RepID=UPI000CF25C1C|nr:hypothetical protein [Enterococcus faecium]AVL46143.1 hypothetical protein CEQ01_13290 [Enterococcus faecium]MCO5449594.1 hypothetical protein [Enterococcus faecium]PQD30464.1 hypothetical protein CUM63_10215 [Enterococcus faecium]
MMEDFIRKNISDEYADFYEQSNKKDKFQMDVSILAILAFSENKQPITAKKETVFSEGKIKTRYILEVETNFKNRSE